MFPFFLYFRIAELNIIVGVKNIHFKNAIRAIYKMFITEEK